MVPQMAASVLCSSVCVKLFLFFASQTQYILPGMNSWTFGRTHHKIFYQILIIRSFCWTLLLAESSSRHADGGSELVRSWNFVSEDLERRCLASIWQIFALYPTKRTKSFCSPRRIKDFSNSAALCFTATWLNDAIPDSALYLLNFQLIRADRDAESTGKSWVAGCAYTSTRGGVQM